MSVFEEFLASTWKFLTDFQLFLLNVVPKVNFIFLATAIVIVLFLLTVFVVSLSVYLNKTRSQTALMLTYVLFALLFFSLCYFEFVNFGIIFYSLKVAVLFSILVFSILVMLYAGFSLLTEMIWRNETKTESAITNHFYVNRVVACPIPETKRERAFRVQNIGMEWFVKTPTSCKNLIDFNNIFLQIRNLERKKLNESERVSLAEISNKIELIRELDDNKNYFILSDALMFIVKLNAKYQK